MIHPILVDNREKNPLPIPPTLEIWARGTHPLTPRSVVVEVRPFSKELPTGDYVHGGDPLGCVIERKASLGELSANLCTANGRRCFLAELERLREFRRPVLFLEGDPSSLEVSLHKKVPHSAPVIRDLFFELASLHGIWTWIMPTRTMDQRRAAGRWIAAFLVQEYLRHASRD